MKVQLISLSILLAIVSACSQGPSGNGASAFADLPANAVKTPYSGNTGLVKVQIPDINGKIVAEGDYLNGQRNGTWMEFYPAGMVKSVTGYASGKKQGAHIVASESGQITEKAYYHHDQLHGNYVLYKSRQVKEERNYELGQLSGLVKIYNDQGTLMEESPYANGLRDGVAKWYNAEGKLIIEYLYKKGEWIKDHQGSATAPAPGDTSETK